LGGKEIGTIEENMHEQIINFNFQLLNYRYMLAREWNFSNVIFPHWHCYWTADHSGGSIHCDGNVWPLDPENLIMIAPGTLIESRNRHPFMQLYCHFCLDIPFVIVPTGVYSVKNDPWMMELIHKICNLATNNNASKSLLPLEVGSFIYHAVTQLPFDTFAQKPNILPKIKQTVDYLRKNYTQHISNTTLAKKINMSRNAFLRLFTQEMGCAPQYYIHQLRIEHACLRLRFSKLSIEEIADETGFNDRYHFSRMFKKFQKNSPAAYRKLMQ